MSMCFVSDLKSTLMMVYIYIDFNWLWLPTQNLRSSKAAATFRVVKMVKNRGVFIEAA